MKKVVMVFILGLALVFSLSSVSSAESSIDDEIQKLTHYAEEYEIGNIDYVRLLIYSSAIRENLNEILGVVSREEGGLLKREQIEAVLGEAEEETKWVWVEGEEREKKLDYYVPVWKTIVFDGKKLQIRLGIFPSLSRIRGEEELVYRLHFEHEFKDPEEQLDIWGEIEEIKSLAEIFNENPSSANGEVLAEASVSAERTFENYFRQGSESCEVLMNDIFGFENKRDVQQMLVQEIEFYSGDRFEAIMRLEMCDDCEWNWINLNMWIEGRGPGFKPPEEEKGGGVSRERFRDMSTERFKAETEKLVREMREFLEAGDHGQAMASSQKLRLLTEAWNEKANDVWKEIEREFEIDWESMTEEERMECDRTFCWIEKEQERRQAERDLRKKNYEERKNFYLGLFSDYEKKEFYFEQMEWEKRLIEEFKEFGEEICDNNKDDNDNGEVDCAEAQCGGKICGKLVDAGVVGNESFVTETDLYCIAGTCQIKEEIIEDKGPVCGNHICEEGEMEESFLAFEEDGNISEGEVVEGGENGNDEPENGEESVFCPRDCVQCPVYDPIECSGDVIFSGEDENSCPLPPLCIEEELCKEDVDCEFLCGVGECMRIEPEDEVGTCKLVELTECREPDCVDGEKKIENCDNGDEIVIERCSAGIWKETGAECEDKGDLGCTKCGNGCITREESTVIECFPTTEEFECVQEGDSCVRKDEVREVECTKCGNSCVDVDDGRVYDCEPPTEEFECFEKNGACVISRPERPGAECVVKGDCGGKHDVCSNGKCVTLPEVIPVEPPPEPVILSPPEEPPKEPEEGVPPISPPEEEPEEVEQEESPPAQPEEEPESEPEPPAEEPAGGEEGVTGNIVFMFFRNLLNRLAITGFVAEEGSGDSGGGDDRGGDTGGDDTSGDSGSDDSGGEDGGTDDGGEGIDNGGVDEGGDGFDGEDGGVPPAPDEGGDDFDREDDFRDDRFHEDDFDRDEDDRWKEDMKRECKENCERNCYETEVKPCVEDCIWEECGDELDCVVDDVRGSCEESCGADTSECEGDCFGKCIKGEEYWEEREFEEEHKEEKGVFMVGGSCREERSRMEGFIWFGGWGKPFGIIQDMKHKYYSGGHADWCKKDLENLKKQRKQFEEGFDDEFVKWFFEDYLANSAEDWEQHVSGIYELYWNNIDNLRQTAEMMNCLETDEMPDYNLISLEKYETEYGSLEYWEEIKTVRRLPGMDREVEMISPYMRVWVFPSRKVFDIMMRESMIKHKMPGPEGEEEIGPSEEEKEEMRRDEGFMEWVRELSGKYGGRFDAVVQFKNFETGEIVFNLYVTIDEENLIEVTPMLYSEVPEEDGRVELDVDILYKMIHLQEKEMRGAMLESPPWAEKPEIGFVKKVTSGIKGWWIGRQLMNSAEFYPASVKGDMKVFLKEFLSGMMGGGPDDERRGPKEGPGGCTSEEECREYCENPDNREECEQFRDEHRPEAWEDKKVITGEVIREIEVKQRF